MRKISKARPGAGPGYSVEVDLDEDRPRGVPGSTVTSWPGEIDLDLGAILARPHAGDTIAGTPAARSAHRHAHPDKTKTVSLSDGTRITFATAGHLIAAEID